MATREELPIAVVAWNEKSSRRRRRQASLGRLAPVEYELVMEPGRDPGGRVPDVDYETSPPLTEEDIRA